MVDFALAQGSSANFQLNDDQVGPTTFQQSSGAFVIDGSIEPIVGSTGSTSFDSEVGAPTNPGSAATPTPEEPGGSTGYLPLPGLTVDQASCNIAYGNLINLTGTKTPEIIYVFVQGSLAGVSFPTPYTWQKVVWLTAPSTTIDIFGRNAQNRNTAVINLNLELRRMGDINGDGVTNDYDLSLLARKWNARNDCATDLNRDGITDDYDLSLLASAWSDGS